MAHQNQLLWEPAKERIAGARIEKFRHYVQQRTGREFGSYEEFWAWSVDELENFWESYWYYMGMDRYSDYEQVLDSHRMPGAQWFTGARLNFAEQVLHRVQAVDVAIKSVSETRGNTAMTSAELADQVMRLASRLREMGIRPGDRVAAYLPAIPEATVAMLATTAVGAVWSSCSPDFGIKGVLERFAQIEPKLLFVVDGYRYNGRDFDRRDVVAEMRAGMDSVQHVVGLGYLDEQAWDGVDGVLPWPAALEGPAGDLQSFAFEQVPFQHPIWILYSSGTTGKPKGIVHSQGGILLEIHKFSVFHGDAAPGSVNFWMTTTGWMLWNALHGVLLEGATMVLYDGHPSFPEPDSLWSIVAETRTNYFGISAAYINALSKTDSRPGERFDLSALHSMGVSGSPLSAEGFEWIYEAVKKDIWLGSVSGGTDVCSGFVGGVPTLPVRAGEIQARFMGCAAYAYNEQGEEVVGEVGELVITKPMPSMPIYFWNDPDNERYLESYFDVFPGVWRHGDYIEFLENGSCIISGRSDSTLNRSGIRIGTAEIYRVLDKLEAIQDSLIVNLDLPGGNFFMPLFVMLREGATLDDDLKKRIASALRSECSPRHVPDEVYAVEQIPMTLTGKKLEVPVKKLLMGVPLERAANPGAMRNPESLQFFIDLARLDKNFAH